MRGVEHREPKAVVWKRLFLDVGSENFAMRKIREVMIAHFYKAFVDLVREVLIEVVGWEAGQRERPDMADCTTGERAPGMSVWPVHGRDMQVAARQMSEALQAVKTRAFSHSNV